MANRLKENILSLFALQAVTYALPLVSLPYLVRVLGSENFGRMAFAMAVSQYFVVLTDYGFNLSATRRIALHKNDPDELSRMLASVTGLKLSLCLAGAGGLVLLSLAVPGLWQADWVIFWAAYLAVLGHALFPGWLFQGLERMSVITGCTVAAQALCLVGLFTLVREPGDVHMATAVSALSPLLAAVLAWFFIWRGGEFKVMVPAASYQWEMLRDGWHVFISTAAISLYTTTNIVVLGLLTNPQAVAYFSVADKLIKAIHGLTAPVLQAVYPHIARLQAQSRAAALDFIRELLRWQSSATLVLSAAILALAGPAVEILFGHDFAPSVEVIRWMALLPFVVGLSNVLGVQTMLNFGMRRLFSRIVLGAGILNLALLVPLAGRFAAQGAAASILLTEIVVVSLMGLSLAREGLLAGLLRRRSA